MSRSIVAIDTLSVAHMNEILNETRRRYERLIAHQPEYGDARDVQRVFGLRETTLYNLLRNGQITGVSVPGRGKKRGKRLFSFDSIRKFLKAREAKAEAK
jgi:hypothetical protein